MRLKWIWRGWRFVLTLTLLVSVSAGSAAEYSTDKTSPALSAGYDTETYITTDNLLMFVTNMGTFARDHSGLFGKSDGLYYPFTTIGDIESGYENRTVIFAAGLWLGAIDDDSGDTLMAIGGYGSEYYPGPMVSGTYDPNGVTNPNVRVFKLTEGVVDDEYNDYLEFAVDQGAPLTTGGAPVMLGDQTLWSVYNDADPASHTNEWGATDPLGIEVQHSVWATSSNTIYMKYRLYNRGGKTLRNCQLAIWADPDIGGASDDLGGCDTLDNIFYAYNATNDDLDYGPTPPAVGFRILKGPVVPSPGDTAYFDGYLLPSRKNLGMTVSISNSNEQDPVNFREAYRYLCGLDRDGTALPNGTRYVYPGDPVTATGDVDSDPNDKRIMGCCGPFDMLPNDSQYVLVRLSVGRGLDRLHSLSQLRSYLNAAYDYPVIGEEASDTLGFDTDTWIDANRLLMFVTNTGGFARDMEDILGYSGGLYFPFRTLDDIESGLYDKTIIFAAGPWLAGIDHDTRDTLTAVSEFGDDFWPGPMVDGTYDPNADSDPNNRVYKLYADSLSGNPGGDYEDYLAYAVDQGAPVDLSGQPTMLGDQMLWTVYNDANPYARISHMSDTDPLGIEIQQTVWAAMEGPNITDCCSGGGIAKTTMPMVDQTIFAIYIRYLIYNKGGRTLDSCFFSLWADPDLGQASDDLVACDTLDDVFFCYNADNDDGEYGIRPPAVGFKFLHGPLVPSTGDSACFNGEWIQDHRNLNMTSFIKYVGGADPQDYKQIYQYMNGLNASLGGIPLENGTTYMVPGDAFTGEGDVDIAPDDRRMMGTCGPFDMNPGDSQYVMVKLAAALGENRLHSILRLREILNGLTPTDTGDIVPPPALPDVYWLGQNYPNPFNPSTRIEFNVPVTAHVRINVYNILGRKVKTLVDANRNPGQYFVDWDGTDNSGQAVSSGLYFYRITMGTFEGSKKMLLVR